MLDIKLIRDHVDQVRQGLVSRGASLEFLDAVVADDGLRRKLVTEVENLKNQRNVVSKEIGMLKSKGQDTTATQKAMRELGDLIVQKDGEVRDIDSRLKETLLRIPNLPHSSLPDGLDAAANVVARTYGAARTFAFEPKGHVEIGERLGIFDFARGARMTGSGFPLYLGQGAKLQRALIQFMLDLHTTEHGYTEMLPPFVVNTASMIGTGQLPKMAEDMYHATDDLWLIPTAEVPVTNYYRDDVIDKPLPVYLTAYTPCFRREAGAAGKIVADVSVGLPAGGKQLVQVGRPNVAGAGSPEAQVRVELPDEARLPGIGIAAGRVVRVPRRQTDRDSLRHRQVLHHGHLRFEEFLHDRVVPGERLVVGQTIAAVDRKGIHPGRGLKAAPLRPGRDRQRSRGQRQQIARDLGVSHVLRRGLVELRRAHHILKRGA